MKITAKITDITKCKVEAIVNAANEQLAPGGGVCGAIHRGAGPGLAAACKRIAPCPTGEARITPGFELEALFVIHAVGPVWRGGQMGEADKLASAYRSALELAEKNRVKSIAFPAISTGIYGFPLAAATSIAVRTVQEFALTARCLETVVFACFNADSLASYRSAGIS